MKQLIEYFKKYRQIVFFLLKLLAVYLFWKFFIWFAGEEKIHLDQRIWPAFSAVWESFNDGVRVILLHGTRILLEILGYDAVVRNDYIVAISGYRGVAVGNYCLGFQLWLVFAALVMFYPGVRFKIRLLYAICGILLINVLNVIRFSGLNLMTIYAPDSLDFNHDYVFNGSVYIITFVLYVYFVRKWDRPIPKQKFTLSAD